jgi:HAD superfamily hydrolase (TIGR01509 family)
MNDIAQKPIKAIIFDMDGVLLDTETICDRTWDVAAKEMSLPKIEEAKEICRGCSKTDTEINLRSLWGKDVSIDDFLKRTSQLFNEIETTEGISLMKGVIKALDYLKNKGYRLALASSTREIVVRRQLTNAKLITYFETITTGDMVTHSKPNPEIYLKAVSSLGLTSADCVAVEDSPNGIRSACDASLKCIMIPDKIQPTNEIKQIIWALLPSLDDIPKVL